MPARLVSLDAERIILIDKPILLIGRHAECDIQLRSSKISRHHCCLIECNSGLVVRDLGSTNGTRVNGEPGQEVLLKSGDELMVGNLRFRVELNLPQGPEDSLVPALAEESAVPPVPANNASHSASGKYDPNISYEFPIPVPEAKSISD